MGLGASDEQLHLAGVPNGLVAVPIRTYRRGDDGELVEIRTRRGLRKTDRIELVPAGAPKAVDVEVSEQRWLLDAGHRRWPGICRRYGDQAWNRSVELARGGVIRLRCAVDERLAVGEPQGWVLADEWEARRADVVALRDLDREHMRERAAAAASAVESRCPELAAALRAAAPSSPTTPVLVYAAEDLVEGVVHAGPRAFSQSHFDHGKAREDVAQVLRDARVPKDVLIALGIRRSTRIGVAGPVTAHIQRQAIALSLFDGPILLRADQRGLTLALIRPVPLVVVENLQAAETLADRRPDVALIYTAGPPSRAGLKLMRELGGGSKSVLLIPDADLGGVRIAERVLGVLPTATLVDVGEFEHPPRDAWPDEGVSRRGLRSAVDGPAGALARACLQRGYPVEQELATIEAVSRLLGPSSPRDSE
jgi:hypothetical protein